MPVKRALLLAAMLLLGGAARAQDAKQFVTQAPVVAPVATGRLVLTVGTLWELGEAPAATMGAGSAALSVASPDKLFWGDLRGLVDAPHAGGSPIDFHGDFRLRLTPDDPWAGK